MEKRLKIGVVTSTHGVRGEVKVFPTTDDPKRFRKLERVILDDGKLEREMEVESVRFFKNMVIVKLVGLDSIEEAQQFRKAELYVDRADAVPLGEDEYYIADLIGMTVESDEGGELGVIGDVLQTGANDVYVIRKEGEPELLVPAIHDCILAVDVPGGRMTVHLLEGLRG